MNIRCSEVKENSMCAPREVTVFAFVPAAGAVQKDLQERLEESDLFYCPGQGLEFRLLDGPHVEEDLILFDP